MINVHFRDSNGNIISTLTNLSQTARVFNYTVTITSGGALTLYLIEHHTIFNYKGIEYRLANMNLKPMENDTVIYYDAV